MMTEDEWGKFVETPYNPPAQQISDEVFDEKFCDVEDGLRNVLTKFGKEDSYGQADFYLDNGSNRTRGMGFELMGQPWFEGVMYDPEWGISSSGEILQWLSLICPGSEVAKHCAWILGVEPKELVKELGLDKESTGWLSSNHAGRVREAQARTAIAWLRCREVM